MPDPKVTQNSSHVVGVLKVSELAEIYLVGLLASGEHDDKNPINIVKKAYSYAGAMVGMRNELLRAAQDQDNAAAGGETTREEALASIDPDEGSDGEVEISDDTSVSGSGAGSIINAPVTEPAPPLTEVTTPEVPPPPPVMSDPFLAPAPQAPTTAPVSAPGDQTGEISSAPKSLDALRGNQ